MLASEIVKPARTLARDPYPGTFSDDALLGQLDLVCLDVMDRVKFPYARVSTPTIAGQQEYVLPETPIDDGTGCVWLNGQLLTKTSITTLQGQEIGFYDQTGMGTQPAGSGGPPVNFGNYTPKWLIQPTVSFPFPNSWQGAPRPFASSWQTNSAPRYYLHGGSIGIVPAPNASAQLDQDQNPIPNLTVEMPYSNAYLGPYVWNNAETQPRALQAMANRIWYPNNFKNTLVWGLVERMGFSDSTQMSKDDRDYAGRMYREQIDECRFWAESYKTDNRLKMQTNRGRVVGRWVRRIYGGGYP
jgi:hypothetical protein